MNWFRNKSSLKFLLSMVFFRAEHELSINIFDLQKIAVKCPFLSQNASKSAIFEILITLRVQ